MITTMTTNILGVTAIHIVCQYLQAMIITVLIIIITITAAIIIVMIMNTLLMRMLMSTTWMMTNSWQDLPQIHTDSHVCMCVLLGTKN